MVIVVVNVYLNLINLFVLLIRFLLLIKCKIFLGNLIFFEIDCMVIGLVGDKMVVNVILIVSGIVGINM